MSVFKRHRHTNADKSPGIRLFFKRLLFLAPIPLILVTVNRFQDPVNLFDSNYEEGIVKYLNQGFNVTNVLNYNERLFQKILIEKSTSCPTEIVLGASRAMQLKLRPSENGTFLNNAMSAASLEDYLAIYNLYEKKGCRISKVFISAEPWLFNENNGLVKWKTLNGDYLEYCRKLSLPVVEKKQSWRDDLDKYQRLFSFSYFKISLKYFLQGTDKRYYPTTCTDNDGLTRLTDGSISYTRKERDLSPEEVQQKAEATTTEKSISYCGNYGAFSLRYRLAFERFVQRLQENGTELVFFLSPYHPTVYNYFKNHRQYQMVFAAERYYREFASRHQIRIIGSYDPGLYQLDNTCFYDGVHCNDKAREIIFSREKEENLLCTSSLLPADGKKIACSTIFNQD